MILTEYNGESLYLWSHLPNWSDPVSIELTVPSRIETGLSDRESRRRLGHSLRVASYQFTSFVEDSALQRLLSALKTRTTERVAMPLWPAMRHPSEFASLGIEVGLNLTFDLLPDGSIDTEYFEIHAETASSTWVVSEQTRTIPLLLGHLNDLDPEVLGKPDVLDVPVRFIEDSNVNEALKVTAPTWQNGPNVNGKGVVIFPLTPNVANPPVAGGTRLLINREIIGQGRRSRNDFHDAVPYETVALNYLCSDSEAWLSLIAFFSERTDWQAFWLPVPLQLTRLALAANGSSQITLLDASEIEAVDSIALWNGDGHLVRRVLSKTGNTLTLERIAQRHD